MLEAAGKPMLHYHIERLKWSGYPIIVATTSNSTDDVVFSFADTIGVACFRGDEQNVLSRYYQAALQADLDIIVRVTSDCPLIDGRLIEAGIDEYIQRNEPRLYLSNALKRSYPRGFDFEIFSFELLSEAYNNASLQPDLEHVTPYINRNRSGNVVFGDISYVSDKSNYRITLDEKDDYTLLKRLIEEWHAYEKGHEDIINILDTHPELIKVNAHIEQKKYGQ
jgi:spore coat polysaccharide biosynthesis protein SpsF